MWYGNEIITHHENNDRGEVSLDACVVLHLADVTHEVCNKSREITSSDRII